MNDLEWFLVIVFSAMIIVCVLQFISNAIVERDLERLRGTIIHLGPGSERLNCPACSEETEIQELMRREDFAVHNGQVYCTECKSTGPLCGQCSNTGAYNRCQAYYDKQHG